MSTFVLMILNCIIKKRCAKIFKSYFDLYHFTWPKTSGADKKRDEIKVLGLSVFVKPNIFDSKRTKFK